MKKHDGGREQGGVFSRNRNGGLTVRGHGSTTDNELFKSFESLPPVRMDIAHRLLHIDRESIDAHRSMNRSIVAIDESIVERRSIHRSMSSEEHICPVEGTRNRFARVFHWADLQLLAMQYALVFKSPFGLVSRNVW